MSLEKILKFKGMSARYPIVQGGMGIGVSLYELCTSVGLEGGIPTLSSVALDQFTRKRLLALGEEVVDVLPGRMDFVEATRMEISDIKKISGDVAINVMCALPLYYEKSLEGAILGGVNMIVSGAGLPSALPSQVKNITGTNDHFINLVPIVSSARALNILIKKWDAQGYRPDAVVLEGPKAGGHLGWNYKQIENSEDFLKEYDVIEHLLPEVLDVANRYRNDFGPILVIVAGGVYTHQDIVNALDKGASAVQMGTRFAVTEESGFTPEAKQLYIDSKKDDIVIASRLWGPPCKYPFRYIEKSPLVTETQINPDQPYFCICPALMGATGIDNTAKKGFPKGCPEGYVLLDKQKACPAVGMSSYSNLVTAGSEAYRVNEVVSVSELMKELIS